MNVMNVMGWGCFVFGFVLGGVGLVFFLWFILYGQAPCKWSKEQ
jgi:hypothetical protein